MVFLTTMQEENNSMGAFKFWDGFLHAAGCGQRATPAAAKHSSARPESQNA